MEVLHQLENAYVVWMSTDPFELANHHWWEILILIFLGFQTLRLCHDHLLPCPSIFFNHEFSLCVFPVMLLYCWRLKQYWLCDRNIINLRRVNWILYSYNLLPMSFCHLFAMRLCLWWLVIGKDIIVLLLCCSPDYARFFGTLCSSSYYLVDLSMWITWKWVLTGGVGGVPLGLRRHSRCKPVLEFAFLLIAVFGNTFFLVEISLSLNNSWCLFLRMSRPTTTKWRWCVSHYQNLLRCDKTLFYWYGDTWSTLKASRPILQLFLKGINLICCLRLFC